jgi:hypothetical protein
MWSSLVTACCLGGLLARGWERGLHRVAGRAGVEGYRIAGRAEEKDRAAGSFHPALPLPVPKASPSESAVRGIRPPALALSALFASRACTPSLRVANHLSGLAQVPPASARSSRCLLQATCFHSADWRWEQRETERNA